VDDLVNAAARDGRVTAVDLGIGLLVLSELADRKGTAVLSLADYRFAGGAEGLLTAYLCDRLEWFPEAEREVVLKALLALTNQETSQRLAEGRSLDALVQEANWPPDRLQYCLDYLAAPRVRLLERLSVRPGDLPSYRLPHERIVPSLRLLTGVILAEAEQTRVTFEAAFRAWQNNGQHRRYLLDRRTLSQVKKHLTHIPRGDAHEAKVHFLERSTRRNHMRWAGVMLGVLVVGMISAVGWWFDVQRRHKNDLSAWGLPPDLYTYQRQLKALEVSAPVRHLRWLKADLITLKIHQGALREVTPLPRTLTELHVSGPSITNLAGLEKLTQLTTLNVGLTNITNLAGLEKLTQLTTLSVNGNITSLAELEKLPRLTTLSVSGPRIPSLAGLEKLPRLTSLRVSGPSITNLAGLEKLTQLTTLHVSGPRSTHVGTLALPRDLKTLYLSNVDLLKGLPTSVTELGLQ
jgi:hypothetical protein